MAKVTTPSKRQYKTDLENLSQKDMDILSLETKAAMTKHKMEKQAVYDRRFALNKKIKQAGLTLDQVLNKEEKSEPTATEPPKKAAAKKVRAKKTQIKKAPPEKVAAPEEQAPSDNMGLMVVNKQVPVIMKPIEINFETFSIKINGMPKKISVNPETNAIEIDL